MTILIITKNYPPAVCGVGDHSAQLKREWQKEGHSVLVYTNTKNASRPDIFTTSKMFFSTYIADELCSLVQQQKIDLVFWQYVPYSYQQKGMPAWLPAVMTQLKKTGVRQAVFFHEVSLRLSGDGPRQSLAAFIQRRIANKIAGIVEQSYTSLALYQSYFRHAKPGIVPVGSNLLALQEEVTTLPYSIVCFANRADNALLNTVRMLRQSLPVTLTLCGSADSGWQQQLEQWARQNGAASWLLITGELSAADLTACLSTAAVIIQPQVTNKNGRGGISAKNGTVMAAMSLGKPIITCKGDMTDEKIFRDNENMLFVPYGDSKAYELAIQRVLKDPELAKKLGTNAAQTYQQYASWPQIAARLLNGTS